MLTNNVCPRPLSGIPSGPPAGAIPEVAAISGVIEVAGIIKIGVDAAVFLEALAICKFF